MEAAQALAQALEGTGAQREDYWRNRVQPFWLNIWPKSRDLISPEISEHLARLCIAAGNEFPAALTAVLAWLQPIAHPEYVVHLLHESGLCSRFSVEALRFLNAIIQEQPWAPTELGQCLVTITQSAPELLQAADYRRLHEYLRQHGG